MTALPLSNAYRNAANQGVGKQAFEDLRDFAEQSPGGKAESLLTIAAGVVVPTGFIHRIDTEGAAATDDLDTIDQTNIPDGGLLLIIQENSNRNVRVRNNVGAAGKIILSGGVNFTLVGGTAWLLLRRAGTLWGEIARFAGVYRERLSASRTYYIRTDGSDANDGLSNTAGGAWATLNKAYTTIRDTLDLSGFFVTVQLADGTYTAQLNAAGRVVGASSPANVVFRGNNGTPANVVIHTTNASCVVASEGAVFQVLDLEMRTTTGGDCVSAFHLGTKVMVGNVRFGACAGIHLNSSYSGSIERAGNYAIVGGAVAHWQAQALGGIFYGGGTITLTGTPAFSAQFARALDHGDLQVNGNTFSGSATGSRYVANGNAVIQTAGGGATYLPGNAVGTTASGGQYL